MTNLNFILIIAILLITLAWFLNVYLIAIQDKEYTKKFKKQWNNELEYELSKGILKKNTDYENKNQYDKELLKHLDDMILNWAKAQLDSLYKRINFWLFTEGLLITAFIASSNTEIGIGSKYAKIAIIFGGFILNIAWYSLCYRGRKWLSWFFDRGRYINKARFYYSNLSYEKYRIIPYKDELKGGIDFWNILIILNITFSALWIILLIIVLI